MSPAERRRRAARSSDAFPSHRRRKRRRRTTRTRRRRTVILLTLFVAVPILVLLGAGVAGTAALGSSCNLRALRPVAIGQNSFVYAADGSLLGGIPAERNRTPVTRSQISAWMPKATVAIEDRRFYSHGGVDVAGIFRALAADIAAGKVVQGGSTITQQLVRNLYISKERTLKRKLVEACLAIKLSQHWSKDRILTAYMNQVYYGNHAYGIEAAAETYFSEPASKLTLEQAAMIAGLPQAPSVYDPFHRPADALRRRDEVLRALLVSGDITSSEYQHAVAQRDLKLKAGRRYTRIREPYFFTYVEDQLRAAYGANTVRSGGLKVYTTIDPRLQFAATRAIKQALYYRTDPAAAVVSIDPRNGAIRAMTAVTPMRKQNQFNLVAQAKRQPGSTFKAIVLTAAIDQGLNPDTTYYLSAPFRYSPDPSGNCDANPPTAWCVETYGHDYLGSTSITNATLHSDNTVYARVVLDVGPEKAVQMAHKLGIKSYLPAVPSLTLGSVAISPLELASAYSTIAAQGVYSKPMAITKVVLASGKVDTSAGWGKPDRTRVIPDGVAYAVTKVLEQNMTAGTGINAHVYGHTDAGKTGTTDNFADAWFCGFTPTLEATVWVGYPKAEIPMLSVHGVSVAGATFPSQIWHSFMQAAIGNRPDVAFPSPQTQPIFRSWSGQYQYGGSTSDSSGTYSSGSSSGSSTSTQPATAPKGATGKTPTTTPTPAPAPTPEPAPAPAPTPEPPPAPAPTPTVPDGTPPPP